MSALQITAIALCLIVPTIGWVLLFRSIFRFTSVFRTGAPDHSRTNAPGERTTTLLREFFGHTRMARIPVVAIAHWFTALSFGLLFLTLVNAFFQLVWPDFALPLIGHFPPYEWITELFAWGGLIGILYLMYVRQKRHPRRSAGEGGRRSRFFGSSWWQAYYVELTILGVVICVLTLRSLEYALAAKRGEEIASLLHFPLTAWMAGAWSGLSVEWVEEAIILVAAIKILISFAWMITISLVPTMGVAWHRFLAFFNIWFKRHPGGATSLGALQPMQHEGKAVTAESLEDIMDAEDESEVKMGVGAVEDFTWKNLLDFSTCTECGRCQEQCPAWNTDKPLSPKLLVMAMRDHSHAKAPFVAATAEKRETLPEHTKALADVPLVGATGYTQDHPLGAYDALGPEAIIDEDVLWSCTTCGACVEQCPVDIEHVDSIVDMRRHQVLIESAFPNELGGLFKNMENKGNPWGMAPKMRLDWAKGLEFDVPIVGQDVEDLSEVDYLFWVGCAGALEDRAKKTTRAVAELLNTAGVSFAVLGEGESCTGDSARRAGNEILYQMLAAQNVEVLDEAGAKKIVVTCAHCFNTLKNEYPQIGGEYEVVHHTQLLNRLVRDKRLTPVSRPEDAPGLSSNKNVASTGTTVTYHDPCYLGRHNQVYAPPRELIGSLPGVTLTEMPRHGMKSFCCGAGGARMWAEEKLGTRININRTQEAVATGADRIAIGCPFCRVMLSDGLTAQQSEGNASEDVEVVDIAQMLLAAVRRGQEVEDRDGAPDTVSAEKGPEVAAPPAAGQDADEVAAAREQGETDAGKPGADEETEHPEAPEDAAKAESKKKPVSASDALAAMAGGGAAAGAAGAAAAGSDEKDASKDVPKDAEARPATAEASTDEASTDESTAPKAGGKMSASDALAAMQSQQTAAGDEETAATTPAETPKEQTPEADTATDESEATTEKAAAEAPETSQAPKATEAAKETPAAPSGKMSATDALAALQAQQSSAPTEKAEAKAEPEPKADAAQAQPEATAEPEAKAQPEPAPEAPKETKAPAAAQDAPPMPSGKMSATDALAALQAQQSSAPAEKAEPEAKAEPTQTEPEAKAEPTQAEPEAKAEPKQAEAEPKADAAAETPTETEAPTATAAPAAAAQDAPSMPSGRMSATDALAALQARQSSAPAEKAEATAEATPAAESEAQPEAEAASEAEAESTPESKQAPQEPESPADDAAPATEPRAEESAPAATEQAADEAEPTAEASSETTDEPQAADEPEPETEDRSTSEEKPEAEAAEPQPEAADSEAPKASGDWAKVREASKDRKLSASEVMKLLGGE